MDEELRAQCMALCVDPKQLLPDAKAAPLVYEVWEEHLEAVMVFEASQSQWRVVAGMAGLTYLGFDYLGVKEVAFALGVTKKRWPQVLMQLQVMEFEGARLFNQRAS